MARPLHVLVVVMLLTSGCSVIVDDMLNNKMPDAGASGPACSTTADCLQIADRVFDCMQVCVGAAPGHPGACVSGMRSPDGLVCGGSGGTQICVGGDCVQRRCGDGYVDRRADPPEYCDNGGGNGPSASCRPNCTRPCVPPARAICDDDHNDCNGMEMCDTASGVCVAQRFDPSMNTTDGTACMVRTMPGTCHMGMCVVN